jgi:glycosyltransferase involved in cell wall biosynthesis
MVMVNGMDGDSPEELLDGDAGDPLAETVTADAYAPSAVKDALASLRGRIGHDGDDEAFPLMVHCHLRWDFVWQRPQQIFSRLAHDHAVLFIEDPVRHDGAAMLDITEPHPGVVRLVPRLPHDAPGGVDGECATTIPLIESALATHPLLQGRFDNAVQWFYSPMSAPAMLGRFGARGVVYDCMDELANFRFAPPDIVAREKFLLERADVVFTGGFQLFEAKSAHHPTVYFHGCGVDVEHFGRARADATVVPASVAGLPGPVLGYFGVIDERLDYDLIAALADRFPEGSVVMAGPFAKVDPAELPQRPNLHWLGQQAYADLPALVKGFDVCLMPFAMNDATRFINPTKTLEYMAAGKPVVSTPVPDVVRNFTPVVAVACSHGAFFDAVDQAACNPDRVLLAEGIRRAEGATWDATVARMRRQYLDAVAPVRRRAGSVQ